MTGQFVTGKNALWIGIFRAIAAGIALLGILGAMLYLPFRLLVAVLSRLLT